MLEALITSKTRIRLLMKFFLNPKNSSYLRGLSNEFEESSNAIRLELNRLEEAGMIHSKTEGNKKMFQVNKEHTLFNAVQQIVRKYVGIDEIISNVVRGMGNLEQAYLTGELAKGKKSNIIDLVLVGDINHEYLSTTIDKAQIVLGKKIKYLIYSVSEASKKGFDEKEYLLIWSNGPV